MTVHSKIVYNCQILLSILLFYSSGDRKESLAIACEQDVIRRNSQAFRRCTYAYQKVKLSYPPSTPLINA
jgi:hypothetical protein